MFDLVKICAIHFTLKMDETWSSSTLASYYITKQCLLQPRRL